MVGDGFVGKKFERVRGGGKWLEEDILGQRRFAVASDGGRCW